MDDIKTYGAVAVSWLSLDLEGFVGLYAKITASILVTLQIIQVVRKWNSHKNNSN